MSLGRLRPLSRVRLARVSRVRRAAGRLPSSHSRTSCAGVVCIVVAAVHALETAAGRTAEDCCAVLFVASFSRSEFPFAGETQVGLGQVSPTPIAHVLKKKTRYSAINAIPP